MANQLDAWKLLPRPERLTELYFTNHARLPATFAPGDPQTVAFTVHNLEHQTIWYRYKLIARTTDKELVLSNDTLTLTHNDSRAITRTITVPPLDHRVEIRVRLEYSGIPFGQDTASLQTQDIHYWVKMTGATTEGGI